MSNRSRSGSIATAACLTPAIAAAYVGPGAGLSLLGAVVAVAMAVASLVVWPLRRMRRRKREAREVPVPVDRLHAETERGTAGSAIDVSRADGTVEDKRPASRG